MIIPWDKAEIKNGLDFMYSSTAEEIVFIYDVNIVIIYDLLQIKQKIINITFDISVQIILMVNENLIDYFYDTYIIVKKRYTITSALPYANGPIHIGHLAGAYIPADIYSRYLKLSGHDVLFVCGSDEHGAAIPIRAKKEGTSAQNIIDKYHGIIIIIGKMMVM